MNSDTLHEELELLPAGDLHPSDRNKWGKGLHFILEQLMQVMTASSEPRIQSRSTQDGQTRFDAYDPVTNQHIRGVSEESLRVWLEQRYYPGRVNYHQSDV